MKKIILFVIASVAAVIGYQYLYIPEAPVWAYRSFANDLFERKTEQAEARTTGQTARQQARTAGLYYSQNYSRFRSGFFYPKYTVDKKTWSKDGKRVTLSLTQIVKADPPGVQSSFGTIFLTFKHSATLYNQGKGWKVESFKFTETKTKS